jgi:outer membrane receptor protein involved in Fe transport
MNSTKREHPVLARTVSLILGTGGVAMGILSVAQAQSAPQPLNPAASAPALEEVIVTAQRRKENILDVPYNINAVSGAQIDDNHVMDIAELMRSVPGVSVVDRGDRNSSVIDGIRIRGLNVDSSALGDYAVSAASTVSSYVNDTPLFANFLLTDINRVEVLEGPQGTLYGSGALGGTVRYILNDPELKKFDGNLTGSISRVSTSGSDGFSGTGTFNFPLGDTLALRVTGTHNNYPGDTDYTNLYQLGTNGAPVAPDGILSPTAAYTEVKDADYAHQNYARAALLWKPNSTFDATFSYTDQSDHFGGRRGTSIGVNPLTGENYQPEQLGAAILEPADRHVYLDALELNFDLGFATLTSSTSKYNEAGNITSDNTGFYAQNGWWAAFYYNYPRPMETAIRTYGDEAFIEEVRLVSETKGSFDYTVGAYYENQNTYSTQASEMAGFQAWYDLTFPAYSSDVLSDQDYLYRQSEYFREEALYGELTWHAGKTVQFTAGARVFKDTDDVLVHSETGLFSFYHETQDSAGAQSANRAIFKLNGSWHFAPTEQLYATVAQGYRRGGTNGVPNTGNFAESSAWDTYKPDSDIDYELGVKGESGGITFNADIFYIDWNNPQINTATTNWGFFAVQNAKAAATQGFELQFGGHFTDLWRYNFGYTYTNAHLSEDAVAADNTYVINGQGARLPGAPVHQMNISTDYTIPLQQAKLNLHADGYFQSSTEDTLFSKADSINNQVPALTTPGPCPAGSSSSTCVSYYGEPKFYYPMGGFWIWNANASYRVQSWDTTLWMKNIGNVAGVTGAYTPAYMGGSPQQNFFGNSSKALTTLPRTIGLTVSYRF